MFRLFFAGMILLVSAGAVSANQSPLAAYSGNWNAAEYAACNTAEKSKFMNAMEKDVVYILNLVRRYPRQFAETVLTAYPAKQGRPEMSKTSNYKSLMTTLKNMTAAKMLQPDYLCWVSANCHATSSGKIGYVGHTRQTKECKELQIFNGECCDYSTGDALQVVVRLLIDEGVASLGHRKILLSPVSAIGVSNMPHKEYGKNTVIDVR